MTFYLLIALWWLIGYCTLVYDWRKTRDFTVIDAIMFAMGALLGPVALLVVWLDNDGGDTVVWKRKDKSP